MMRLLIVVLISFSGLMLSAQVELDRKLTLTGSGSDARIEGVEFISDPDDAANKIYVDTAITNRTYWIRNGSGLHTAPSISSVGIDTIPYFGKLHVNNGPIVAESDWDGQGGAMLIASEKPTIRFMERGAYPSAVFNQYLIHQSYGALRFFNTPGALSAPGSYGVSGLSFNERLTIDSLGRVGVGSSHPAHTLVVTRADNATVGLNIGQKGTGTANNSELNFITLEGQYYNLGNAATKGWQLAARSNSFSATSQRNDLMFYYWNGSSWTHTMSLDGLGRVGILTDDPSHLLHVNGVARSTSTSWTTSSDRRVKENIRTLDLGLREIMQLRPVVFDWTTAYRSANPALKQDNIGFIAQEVGAVFPSMTETVSEQVGDEVIDDFQLLNLSDLLPVMVKAIQEQQAKIEALEARINELENRR